MSQAPGIKRPPKAQLVKKDTIHKLTRFVTDKATIHDEKKAHMLLGADLGVAKLGVVPEEDKLSSRELKHHTVGQKISDLKRASKYSPAFAPAHSGKEKPDQLLPTPAIPMPERYYYSKNKALLSEKLQAIEQSQLRSKGASLHRSMGRPLGQIRKPLNRN